jgi:hypothetical protein
MDHDLPTITEEEDTDVLSVAAESSKNAEHPFAEGTSTGTSAVCDDDKKKKKKAKSKSSSKSEVDYDTAQQILIDLCTEMKDLKKSMQEGQKKAVENLDSNQHLVTKLADQMEMLRGNMTQLDQAIESKATPKQIEDMGRIRAVQEIVKEITDDKERTVGVYEVHARRGYEEIERLRRDLDIERGEVAALRAELNLLRGDRQRMLTSSPSPANNGSCPANVFVNADDSVGGESERGRNNVRPGALYINGVNNSGMPQSSMRGDLDDMTLNTKESYETSAYEMKSLKKRIIHMKKKLEAAQLEAKETGELRGEVERLRVQSQLEAKETGELRREVERLRIQAESDKKASKAKDELVKSLEDQMFYEMLSSDQPAAKTSTADTTERSLPSKPLAVTALPTKKSTTKTATRTKKWWDI